MSAVAPAVDHSTPSVAQAYRELVAELRAAAVPAPELDARLLVCAACGLTHEAFVARPERPLSGPERARLALLTGRRRAREPVSRILGKREFWGRNFMLGPDTLDPRPDSETLIEAALDLLGRQGRLRAPLSVLDLGTGTGCLLLTLLAELPRAWGVGVDVSAGALRLAQANASRLGLARRACFVQGSWAAPVGGAFDLVIANPPYVPRGEIGGLAPEVADHDPLLALDGGEDGLAAYRAIALGLTRVLDPEGVVLLEVGMGQSDSVAEIFEGHGLKAAGRPHLDLAGVPRCLAVRRFGLAAS